MYKSTRAWGSRRGGVKKSAKLAWNALEGRGRRWALPAAFSATQTRRRRTPMRIKVLLSTNCLLWRRSTFLLVEDGAEDSKQGKSCLQ